MKLKVLCMQEAPVNQSNDLLDTFVTTFPEVKVLLITNVPAHTKHLFNRNTVATIWSCAMVKSGCDWTGGDVCVCG